ncbi:MAG: hypothetical protein GWO07_03015 [Candidatus Dadabacteria bacterium]|nr:hypothetical protein [Candidatus Dadabacteria bacterium]NIS07737.1 hypothetical protein [Candidatus Dadabacteria bacterium]NIV42342.1 hypothetical protein [Candidatus Dadabacteria bacterium]NIY21378.1 hypothetical protein [Candidatus Dadabacteria bacterium]
MELEELIQSEENKEKEQLNLTLEIAEKEWNKIRESLSLCGDIGEFSKEDYMVGIIEEDLIVRLPKLSPTKSVSGYSPTFYPMYFIKNIERMSEKFPEKGYRTTEALYSFIELATKAAERLGLRGTISMAFGVGYANVRTGWIAEKGLQKEREIFEQMFFSGKFKHYDWECDWTSVKQALREIFDKFNSWQDDEVLYKKESDPKKIVKPMLV